VNGAASDNHKVSSLIIVLIGPEMYAVLKNLMLPGVIKVKNLRQSSQN